METIRIISENIAQGKFEKIILDWHDGEVNSVVYFKSVDLWFVSQLCYFNIDSCDKVYFLTPIQSVMVAKFELEKNLANKGRELVDLDEMLQKIINEERN
jgi:hypothetical protein